MSGVHSKPLLPGASNRQPSGCSNHQQACLSDQRSHPLVRIVVQRATILVVVDSDIFNPSVNVSSGDIKYQRTLESFRMGARECTSMQGHRTHTRHELPSVEHQIHHLRMFGLNPQISSWHIRSEHPFVQRDKYSGSPSRNELNPLALAGAFGGSSMGIASKEIMVIVQYAPLYL